MRQAEKGLASSDEVTGIFAFLSNCGKVLSQSWARRANSRDAADEDDLGSEFPWQIGSAAVEEAIVSRLRDYAAGSLTAMQVLAGAALFNPRSVTMIQVAR